MLQSVFFGRFAPLLHPVINYSPGPENKPFQFLVVGVYNGARCAELLSRFKSRKIPVKFYGFDLFEDLTQEKNFQEFGKRYLPPSLLAVESLFLGHGFSQEEFQLIKGDSTVTLPEFFAKNPSLRLDMIFIDGGHSLETIRSDWEHCSRHLADSGVIFLDDYYDERSDVGCKLLVEELCRSSDWSCRIGKEKAVERGLDGQMITIRMVEVRKVPKT